MSKIVNICGIGYRPSIHEGLVVLTQETCIDGRYARMSFRSDSDKMIWLFKFDSTSGTIPLCHIVAAEKWLHEEYGADFEIPF